MEIERKFLVTDTTIMKHAMGQDFKQGYLSSKPNRVVRVRTEERNAFLTIKGPKNGCSCEEYEYAIPFDDAVQLFGLCEHPLIEKTRYKVYHEGFIWEVDVFHGENQGLIVAEIELEHEGQIFSLPFWIGQEVTPDNRYSNNNLVSYPYSMW